MTLGSVYVAVPAAAAAMGFYLFGKNNSIIHGGEYPATGLLAKEKKDGRSGNENAPKLAPQFDGLNCFETIVRR